jgi:DNA-3-methyladenine glycosylase
MSPDPLHILSLDAPIAAPLLIGWIFEFGKFSGRIVETEAYTETDPASHSYGGRRPRNATMFKTAGHLYVYRSYGVHWCANLVTGPEGSGQAVLLRALEPIGGVDSMLANRPGTELTRLCAGPGNLTAAFGLSGNHDGIVLGQGFGLKPGISVEVWSGPRIGISKAVDLPYRFFERNSRFLSRKNFRHSGPFEVSKTAWAENF